MYEHFQKVGKQIQEKTPKLKGRIKTGVYWHLGRMIATEERRKEMDESDLKVFISSLSQLLEPEFGKIYGEKTMREMHRFYLAFPKYDLLNAVLSWSHYLILSKIEVAEVRNYYADEAIINTWSTRQLLRQISAKTFERQPEISTQNFNPIFKNEYVLEFAAPKDELSHSEHELENQLLTHLQELLTELGGGYSFVARQKRITSPSGKTFFADLVFYHFVKKCFVIIELKTRPLSHENLGQTDMYVRLWDAFHKSDTDAPTLGIVLCPEVDSDFSEYSLLKNNAQVFAASYRLSLPNGKLGVTGCELGAFLQNLG